MAKMVSMKSAHGGQDR